MLSYYNINAPISETFSIKGKGENKILLVISEPQSAHLQSKLQEIMQAVHFDLEIDTYYLFEASGFTNLGTYINENMIDNALVFGLNVHDVGLNLTSKPYQIIQLEKTRLVFCDALTDVLETKTLKLTFWKLLQKLFLHT